MTKTGDTTIEYSRDMISIADLLGCRQNDSVLEGNIFGNCYHLNSILEAYLKMLQLERL